MKDEKIKLLQLLLNKSKIRDIGTHLLTDFNIQCLSAVLNFNIWDCHEGGY